MKNFQHCIDNYHKNSVVRVLALICLLSQCLWVKAAEDTPEVEYATTSYHKWKPMTDYNPTDGLYTQFNFCYYNDCGYDSWCDGIKIYVDDEYVGILDKMAGFNMNTVGIMPESVSISSPTNGKIVAKTTGYHRDGDDYWVNVQIYVQEREQLQRQ